MNCSNPLRRSSMNSSSNIPSSRRRNAGICRFHALLGNAGTTIYDENNSILDIRHRSVSFTLLSRSSSLRNHSKSEYRRRTEHSFNRKTGKFV